MDNAKKNLHENSPYQKLVNVTNNLLNGQLITSSAATSEQLATDFYRAATDTKPKRRYYHSLGDRFSAHFARSHQGAYHTIMTSLVNRVMKRAK